MSRSNILIFQISDNIVRSQKSDIWRLKHKTRPTVGNLSNPLSLVQATVSLLSDYMVLELPPSRAYNVFILPIFDRFVQGRGLEQNITIRMEAAQQLATRLSQFPWVERVIVFGSTAKGKAGKKSDIDIAVVIADNYPYDELGKAQPYLSKTLTDEEFCMDRNIPMGYDLKVIWSSFFDGEHSDPDSLIRQVRDYGVTFYLQEQK